MAFTPIDEAAVVDMLDRLKMDADTRPKAYALAHRILHMARRTPGGGLARGDVAASVVELGSDCGLSRQEVRTLLDKFVAGGFVEMLPATNRLSNLRLLSMDLYVLDGQTSNQPATSQQPASNQPATSQCARTLYKGETTKGKGTTGGEDLKQYPDGQAWEPDDPAYSFDPSYNGTAGVAYWDETIGPIQPRQVAQSQQALWMLHKVFKRSPTEIRAMIDCVRNDTKARAWWGGRRSTPIQWTREKDGKYVWQKIQDHMRRVAAEAKAPGITGGVELQQTAPDEEGLSVREVHKLRSRKRAEADRKAKEAAKP